MRLTLGALVACLSISSAARAAKDNVAPIVSDLRAANVGSSEATIVWTTDEPADSRVDYGVTSSLGSNLRNSALVTAHSVRIAGLQPGALYYYRVTSRDRAQNRAVSSTQTFQLLDTTPPVISGVAATTVSASGATIVWTTGEPADSEVVYGATASYGLSSGVNAALVTSHSVTLAGLAANTTYHYSVRSLDAARNPAASGDFTFLTLAADTAPPVISGVAATGITASGATIAWTTNEAADSQVEYGTTTAYGSTSPLNAARVTAHSVSLAALNAQTVYHYRVHSSDASGNGAISADQTFTTAAAGSGGSVLDYSSPYCDEGVPSAGYPWACGPWPSSRPPALGAVNTATLDPDTGNRVLRVTAAGSFGQTGSASYFTNYGGWDHDWAADDSAFLVRMENGDGGKFWVGFDPATMQLTGTSGRLPSTFAGNLFAFDETDPALIVAVQGSQVVAWNRFTQTTTPVFDLTAATSVFTMTAKGSRICVANGPQDSGYIVECYNRASGARQVINVEQQTVNGAPYSIWYRGGITTQPAAGIHALTLSADGRWAAFDLHSTPACSATGLSSYAQQGLVMDLETGLAYSWSSACGNTHWAFGFDGAMVQVASPQWTPEGFHQAGSCPYDDERGIVTRTAGTTIDSSIKSLYCPPSPAIWTLGVHLSWQNNRSDANRNRYPVAGAVFRHANSNAFLFNDVFAAETTQPAKLAKIWRFAQTWNDVKSANCDFLGWTSPTVSRSGRYLAYPSNWMGQTGPGGCTNGKRTDVFVFELK